MHCQCSALAPLTLNEPLVQVCSCKQCDFQAHSTPRRCCTADLTDLQYGYDKYDKKYDLYDKYDSYGYGEHKEKVHFSCLPSRAAGRTAGHDGKQ